MKQIPIVIKHLKKKHYRLVKSPNGTKCLTYIDNFGRPSFKIIKHLEDDMC